MSSYLTLPSGKPNPYAPKPAQQAGGNNPWASYGLDPTQRQAAGQQGNFKQASDGLTYYAQQRGKTIDQGMWDQLAQKTGYKGDDKVSGQMYNQGLDYLDSQWGPNTPQTGGVEPKQQMPELGPNSAIEQWKQQAPAAGVPQSFRNANPYYAQQQQNMSKILANPETMNQQWQDRQNEQQKESASRMMQQAGAQGQQALAGRGFGGGGGAQQALQAQNQQQLMQNILSGRRDTAQQAVTQNRQDQYNALDASSRLAGQEFDSDFNLSNQALGQINQNRGQNLQEFLGLHGADLDMLQFGENKSQFNKGFGLDFLRYLAQKDQFGQSLGENQRQFNGQQGFNWANLNAQQQQNMMNTVMGWF